jgi:lipid-binding SYLF domain-containing protein
MRKLAAVVLGLGLAVGCMPALAEEPEMTKQEKKEAKAEENRDQIDATSEETMKELLEKSENAKELYDEAYGYATFAQTEAKLMFSSGSGRGVAIVKETGERTYMKMASAGVGLGLGVQRVRVVFLFETEKRFDNFVNKGWDADASASAAAADAGANVKASFIDGMALFQFTKAGLIAQASVKGTKYWDAEKLNEPETDPGE